MCELAGELDLPLEARETIRACMIRTQQLGADFVLQIVVTPVEKMLEDQHPDDDVRRRAEAATPPTLWPPFLTGPGHDFNHGPRPRGACRFCATSRATACAHPATRLRTNCARVVGAEPCPLLWLKDHARAV